MRFTVVIPTYQRGMDLRQPLMALTHQDYPDYEVIVVDDASTDNTTQRIASEFPQVRYLRHETNRGPAAARNWGIREATGEIVAFTDDDCLPPHNWLTDLAAGYTRYPEAIGVGGYLEAPAPVLQQNILARYETHIARTVYHVGEQEYLGGFECPAGGTNNLSYRRSVLLQIGGFDEYFRFAAGEDADLKWRLCQQGCQLLYLPIKMTHLQSYSWARFRRQSFFRGRGRTQFEIKRRQPPTRLKLAGRLVRVMLNFPLDGIRMPEKAFAIAKLIEGIWGIGGQWTQLRQL